MNSPRGGYYGGLADPDPEPDPESSAETPPSPRSVIGGSGDFVTSPEISQLFGEMVGLWCVDTWHKLGSPSTLRLVELGPGKGPLLMDILRATTPSSPKAVAFKGFQDALTNGPSAGLHLVELSKELKGRQER